MTGETIPNGRGVQALYHNVQQAKLRGYGTVPGNAPTPSVSSTDRAVDVTSGEVLVDGDRVTVSAQTKDTTTGDSDPRRDIWYIDATGTLKVKEGTPAAPLQAQLDRGESEFELYKPHPPDSTGITGVVVAEAYIPAGASDFQTSEFLDLTVASLITQSDFEAVKEQILPRYDDPANAPQKNGSVIVVPPSGSVAEGVYKYDSASGGYTLLDESSGATAGNLSDLTIDTNKDWGGYNISNLGSLDTANATVGESITPEQSDYTLYVRAAGSDSNTGLSSSQAVASISQALENIIALPINTATTGGPSVTVNIEGGATFTESDELRIVMPWVSRLRLVSSDGTQWTLKSDSDGDALQVTQSFVEIDDGKIDAVDATSRYSSAISATKAYIRLRAGTEVTGAAVQQISGNRAAAIEVGDNATVTGLGKGGSEDCIRIHSSSYASVDPQALLQDAHRGLSCQRGSTADVSGDIDNCTDAVLAENSAAVKVQDGTISNCDTAIIIQNDGVVDLRSSATLSSNTTDIENTSGTLIDTNGDTKRATASGYVRVDDSPGRSLNTNYTNESNGDLEVKVQIIVDDATGGDVDVNLRVGTLPVERKIDKSPTDSNIYNLSGTVKPGTNYKIEDDSECTVSIFRVFEQS